MAPTVRATAAVVPRRILVTLFLLHLAKTSFAFVSLSPVLGPVPMATLLPRGGGGTPRKAIGRPADATADDDKHEKAAIEALASIQYCYRACFVNLVCDTLTTILEAKSSVRHMKLTLFEAVDVFDSLNLLYFAVGLRRMSKLYGRRFEAGNGHMTLDCVFELCRTMAAVWRTCALTFVVMSASTAALLTETTLKVLLNDLGLYILPGGIATIAFVGGLVLNRTSARDVSGIVANNDEKKKGGAPNDPNAERARSMGFRASRNMLLFTGSLFLFAATQFTKWLLTPVSHWTERLFSVYDFITPITIASLLVPLYRGFLRAVATATSYKDVGYGEYNDLFEAQKGFYSQVGDTVKSAAIFTLLPFVYGVIKPYIVVAVKIIAPSLVSYL